MFLRSTLQKAVLRCYGYHSHPDYLSPGTARQSGQEPGTARQSGQEPGTARRVRLGPGTARRVRLGPGTDRYS